jgi:hypothetical protein
MNKLTVVGLGSVLLTLAAANVEAAGQRRTEATGPFTNDTVAPKGGSVVLYDQFGAATNGAPTQDFTSGSYDQYDSEGADDFVVPAGGWSVTGFNFQNTVSANGNPTSGTFNISVYPNSGTLPGTPAVCTYANVAATFGAPPQFSPIQVTLPTACALAPGTYWVSMAIALDFTVGGQMFWSLAAAPNIGNPGVFRRRFRDGLHDVHAVRRRRRRPAELPLPGHGRDDAGRTAEVQRRLKRARSVIMKSRGSRPGFFFAPALTRFRGRRRRSGRRS